MSDPISGAGGGAAKIALQQLQQMQNQQPMQQPQIQSGGQSSFAQKLNQPQEIQQTQQVSEVQKTTQSIRPDSIRNTTQSQQVQQNQRVEGSQKSENTRFNKTGSNDPSGAGEGIARYFNGVDSRKTSLDNMVKQAMNGKNFNNRQLLVLQYKVSSFSMEMDLTSKMVEKATGGIKQAMNTQV
jgi:hypothetical protein